MMLVQHDTTEASGPMREDWVIHKRIFLVIMKEPPRLFCHLYREKVLKIKPHPRQNLT